MVRESNKREFFFVVLFFTIAVVYLIFFQFWVCLGSQRSLTIQKITEHGLIVINSIAYKVPYKAESTIINVYVDNLTDYLFLSNSKLDESLLSCLVKIFMCLTIILTMLNSLFSNKNVPVFIGKLMPYLIIAFIGVEFFQYRISAAWVSNPNHKLLGYQYASYWSYVSALIVPFISLAMWLRIQNI